MGGAGPLPQSQRGGPGGGSWETWLNPRLPFINFIGWAKALAGKALEHVRSCKVEGCIKQGQPFGVPATGNPPVSLLHLTNFQCILDTQLEMSPPC